MQLDDWVLCRIYKKSTNAQRAGKERDSSSCVEEVLASLPEIDHPKILLPRLGSFSGFTDQDLQHMSSMPLLDSFLTGDTSENGGSPSVSPGDQVDSSSDLLQSASPRQAVSPKLEHGNSAVDQFFNGEIGSWKVATSYQEQFMKRVNSELLLGNAGGFRQHPPALRDMEDEAQSSFRSPNQHSQYRPSSSLRQQQQQQLESSMSQSSNYEQDRTSNNIHQNHGLASFPMQSDGHILSTLMGQASNASNGSYFQEASHVQQRPSLSPFLDFSPTHDLRLSASGQRGR
jgi:hypothetical protein